MAVAVGRQIAAVLVHFTRMRHREVCILSMIESFLSRGENALYVLNPQTKIRG